jgi:IclR family pca regulon transcriptional regulator
MLTADGDAEFMTSLARGIAVLRCFADEQRPMTIAQASRVSGLCRLGYATRDGQAFALRPKVLELGYAFLSSSPIALRAQPLLDRLRDELHESCSLGVLEDDQVYYIARAEVGRIMSVALRVGSRLPVYCTSMGRVLMSGQEQADRAAYLARTDIKRATRLTETDPARLLALFEQARHDGYAIVDQELEVGLRSLAVPVLGSQGVVAAINLGGHASRIPVAEMQKRYLPALRRAAKDLGAIL